MSDVINAHDLGVAGGYIIEAAMQGDIDKLKDENAELRNDVELLRAMLSQVQTEKRCYMAENAKLREQVASLIGRSFRTADKTDCLNAENAKLRELVLDAWGDGHPDRSCEGCDIRDECHDDVERMRKDGVLRFSRCLFELRIEERMRELGIEVDDG